ncbi:MAG TPA: DUF6789 family protein [Longimicrobiaceae bacterium]|nr:DUF6789 family protein [Longimicrobiaceae bacterium]
MNRVMDAILEGAIAGTVATLPMSALMLAAGKVGLMGKQPPEEITEDALGAAGVRTDSEEQENVITVLGHLGYGASMGALFSVLHHEIHPPIPPTVHGVCFALGVWALSYKGWVPALGIMPPPAEDRPGRPESMIAAHIVYGAALGAIVGEP